jgi:XapX domain-containing protein
MQAYAISLAVGVMVGVIYGVIGVRSPAPPLIALAGLLGIVVGEAAVPVVKHMIAGHPPAVAWAKADHGSAALGCLPGEPTSAPAEGDTRHDIG